MEVITQYHSPIEMLTRWAISHPDKIYMHQPIDGKDNTYTWKETAEEVRKMAAYLKSLDFPKGSKIALVSKNCSHWIICDLAIMMAGHVSVPLYPNLASSSVRYILDHSDTVLLFVGKLDNWAEMKSGVQKEMRRISFPDFPQEDCERWNDLVQDVPSEIEFRHRTADETGTILYTSGTTGTPKGVVHRFSSFSFTTQNAIPWLGFHEESRFFSYLPLSHSAERSLVEMGSLYCGGTIYFSESIKLFGQNLADAKPTEFLAVHHIWKTLQMRILQKIPQRRLDFLLSIPLVSGWVKHKIKKQLGLQCANNILTGASPMPVDLMEWFKRIDIPIQEAYGMTENWSYSHINRKGRIKFGFVGQPFPGVETMFSPEGEILVRHPGVLKEYYKDPVSTARALNANGFLCTEDSGYADDEGYLKITGRVKDIFKTSKGNYVAPAPIEVRIAGDPNVEFVCVVGSQLPQPIALILLSIAGKSKAEKDLIEQMKTLLHEVNQGLDPVEKLTCMVILNDVWDVEHGQLTPTYKVKRYEIEKQYGGRYPQWQALGKEVVIN